MEFRILGPLEVRECDRPVVLGGHKQRALLAILLSQANQVVPKQRLLDLLWGEEALPSARHSLQVYISQLRKALTARQEPGKAGGALVSHPTGYLLRVDPGQLDLDRFQQLAQRAREAASSGDHQNAVLLLRDALGLWRGPAYADVSSEPFAFAESSRLNEMRLRAVEDRIEADLHLGKHADLIGELEALVAEHPLRERLAGQLMLALYRSGRQAEASNVFQRTRELLVDEQGMEPGVELQSILKRILNQDASLELVAKESTRRSNLPQRLTRFVGRQEQIREVIKLLASYRLVTLTGAGGVGKTRLAIEVASTLQDEYADGAWMVELASLADGALVAQTTVSALGLTHAPGRTHLETLIGYLRSRQLLLVLDNCEHLVEAVAELCEALLSACPRLRLLATSRELLRVGGESGWRVPSLASPPLRRVPKPAELTKFEAIELFCDRAAAAVASFTLDEINALQVVTVCSKLDGIPLAIELAAARLRLLSLEQLVDRLEDRLHILTAGERSAPPRQRTLRATIEWSHELLDDHERLLFERLSVFAGPFNLAAAEAVAPGGAVESSQVIDVLGRLADKSLLQVEHSVEEPQYRLLETLREFGRERLTSRGELEAVQRRHAEFFCGLAERAREALMSGDQAAMLLRLESSLDNLRAALSWASQDDPQLGLRGAAGLVMFWATKGLFVEGRRWLDLFLRVDAPSDLMVLALNGAGLLAQAQGDLNAALDIYRRSLGLAQAAGNELACAKARNNIGAIVYLQGDFEAARQLYEEGLAILRRIGTPFQVGSIVINLCLLALGVGDAKQAAALADEARSLFEEIGERDRTALCISCLARARVLAGRLDDGVRLASESLQIFRELGDQSEESVALRVLGDIALRRGALDEAGSRFGSSLAINQDLGVKIEIAASLESLAEHASCEGKPERTLRLAGAAATLRRSIGAPLEPVDRLRVESVVAGARSSLGSKAAAAAWSAGSSTDLADIVVEALAAVGAAAHEPSTAGRSV